MTSGAHFKGHSLASPNDPDEPAGQGPELLEGNARERRARRRAEEHPRHETESGERCSWGAVRKVGTAGSHGFFNLALFQ
jgi:hypothetical protein